MPAVEIADSIVQSGRETLEKVGVWLGLGLVTKIAIGGDRCH